MYKQLFKYLVIGAASAAIDFAVYFCLTRTLSVFANHLIEAKMISFFVSSIFNFGFNKKWTFNKKTPLKASEVAKYYTVSLVALSMNALFMFIFLKIFTDLIAWLFAASITTLFNFFLSRLWVFKNNPQPTK